MEIAVIYFTSTVCGLVNYYPVSIPIYIILKNENTTLFLDFGFLEKYKYPFYGEFPT